MPEEEKPTFGKYQVVELLGEGGMGRVWRAFDPDLEVPVAIKELKEQFRDSNNLERFYREAQIAAKCRHQNIVLITDLSKDPPYFAMEFLEAQELSIYVHKGKPISGARVIFLNEDTGETYQASTDGKGGYEIELPEGEYIVDIQVGRKIYRSTGSFREEADGRRWVMDFTVGSKLTEKDLKIATSPEDVRIIPTEPRPPLEPSRKMTEFLIFLGGVLGVAALAN